MLEVDEVVQKSYELAIKSRELAHCPYSHFHVGAALKMEKSETIFVGCNVENASYGATICAERTALVSAIAKNGKGAIEFVLVVTDTSPATWPCALCLQVLAEFCSAQTPIYLSNLKGIERKVDFKELLPSPFTSFEV